MSDSILITVSEYRIITCSCGYVFPKYPEDLMTERLRSHSNNCPTRRRAFDRTPPPPPPVKD